MLYACVVEKAAEGVPQGGGVKRNKMKMRACLKGAGCEGCRDGRVKGEGCAGCCKCVWDHAPMSI